MWAQVKLTFQNFCLVLLSLLYKVPRDGRLYIASYMYAQLCNANKVYVGSGPMMVKVSSQYLFKSSLIYSSISNIDFCKTCMWTQVQLTPESCFFPKKTNKQTNKQKIKTKQNKQTNKQKTNNNNNFFFAFLWWHRCSCCKLH